MGHPFMTRWVASSMWTSTRVYDIVFLRQRSWCFLYQNFVFGLNYKVEICRLMFRIIFI